MAPSLSRKTIKVLKTSVAVLCVLLPVLIFLLLHIPQRTELQQVEASLAAARQTYQLLERTAARLPGLTQQKEEFLQLLSEFEGRVPTTIEFPLVVSYVEQEAAQYGFQVLRSTHGNLQRSSSGVYQEVLVELVGTYRDLVEYTHRVLHALPSARLSEYVLVSQDVEELSLRLGLRVHVLEDIEGSWKPPMDVPPFVREAYQSPFGVNTTTLQNLLASIQLLGVVSAGSQSYALTRVSGREQWSKVGDSLGRATLAGIDSTGIRIYYGGVNLFLGIGGTK